MKKKLYACEYTLKYYALVDTQLEASALAEKAFSEKITHRDVNVNEVTEKPKGFDEDIYEYVFSNEKDEIMLSEVFDEMEREAAVKTVRVSISVINHMLRVINLSSLNIFMKFENYAPMFIGAGCCVQIKLESAYFNTDFVFFDETFEHKSESITKNLDSYFYSSYTIKLRKQP